MQKTPKNNLFSILIVTEGSRYKYDQLTVLPQVQYLGEGHYMIDFGVEKLYLAEVQAITVLREEVQAPEEEPIVTLAKEKI